MDGLDEILYIVNNEPERFPLVREDGFDSVDSYVIFRQILVELYLQENTEALYDQRT